MGKIIPIVILYAAKTLVMHIHVVFNCIYTWAHYCCTVAIFQRIGLPFQTL